MSGDLEGVYGERQLRVKRVTKLAHTSAHKNVPTVQLKQWMQCMQGMQCEFFRGNLVLIDSKGVGPP